MNDVGFETPTESMKAQRSTPRTNAQTKEITPWSMLGGLRCMKVIVLALRV